MLVQQTWQEVSYIIFLSLIIYVLSLMMSILSGYFNWYLAVTIVFLIISFYIVILLIPTFLNLSRSFYSLVLILFAIQLIISVVAFALHYKSNGLLISGEPFNPNFIDSIYFSVTTFTTLGYGDFQPKPEHRLTTSAQALFGMFSMAVWASITWLWCVESILPKDMTFYDGYRRHKSSPSPERIRLRTLLGRERNLEDWRLPFGVGVNIKYDEEIKEWVTIKEEPENGDKDHN